VAKQGIFAPVHGHANPNMQKAAGINAQRLFNPLALGF